MPKNAVAGENLEFRGMEDGKMITGERIIAIVAVSREGLGLSVPIACSRHRSDPLRWVIRANSTSQNAAKASPDAMTPTSSLSGTLTATSHPSI